ncbi:MAG: molybdenum cofactor guanylyltransferase [Actinomycetota bacterium]
MDGATGGLGAVVLAGGRSARMGTDKALMDFCGRRMIDHVVERLGALTDRVVVVTKRRDDLGPLPAVVLEDEEPHLGPLPALIAGLRVTGEQRNVVVACDMPFLNVDLLRRLAGTLEDDTDAVVPTTAEGAQPLHAAYGDCAIENLLSATAAGERSLKGSLARLRIRWFPEEEWKPIDPDGRSFLNVNTPDELQNAIALQTTT